jgi:hypothetical protein
MNSKNGKNTWLRENLGEVFVAHVQINESNHRLISEFPFQTSFRISPSSKETS